MVAYFCTFHTSHFSIDYTMIITMCHYVCYSLYVNMQCEYVNMQHTLLTSKKNKCVIMTALTKHVSGENSKTEFKLRKNHEALMFLDIL